MAKTYHPDKWVLVHFDKGKDPHYRVFGSWSGSFLEGDEWRLSSGVTHVDNDVENPNVLIVTNSSGSKYIVPVNNYGTTAWTGHTLESLAGRWSQGDMDVKPLDHWDAVDALLTFPRTPGKKKK